MPIANSERTLDYTPIVGPGVDALEHRKEHNNNKPATAAKLRASIDKVKDGIFEALKMLRVGAQERVQK